MVTVSLDSPSCEVTLFDPVSVVYRDVTRQAKGLYRLKYVGALWSGLAYLSRYNSGCFCHTTHCDLNNFCQNRQGRLPGHDTALDPIHYPYSDCKIVNMQLLCHASDTKSLDFYRLYLAERLRDKDSGTLHWIPKILCN
jgi:hypothetical protein